MIVFNFTYFVSRLIKYFESLTRCSIFSGLLLCYERFTFVRVRSHELVRQECLSLRAARQIAKVTLMKLWRSFGD